jgi:hypothetical protein
MPRLTGTHALHRLAQAPLQLGDLHSSTLVALLRKEHIQVNGQTVTITDTGRQAVAELLAKQPAPSTRSTPIISKRDRYRDEQATRERGRREPPFQPSEELIGRLAELFDLLSRHPDGTRFSSADHYQRTLLHHLNEPPVDFPTEFTGPGPTNRFFAGHGYKLDDDTFEFPPTMGVEDFVTLHVDLHGQQPAWPHQHRLFHDNERHAYASELGLPVRLVTRLSEQGWLLSFDLPRDEAERQQRLLALGQQGTQYVYTANGPAILQLHRTPTHRDLLAHASHAASVLYCTGLWYHLEHQDDLDQWRPTTLAAHNQVIDQLTAHPQQRERVGDRWRVYLLCDQCDRGRPARRRAARPGGDRNRRRPASDRPDRAVAA